MMSVTKIIRVWLFFMMVMSCLGMSTQKSATGKLVVVGNEPFTYFILKCDDGSKLRLSEKNPEWMALQGNMVELIYTQTSEKKILPVVKVVELRVK